MKIAVAGTGYVGLVLGSALAETGNEVACVDIDEQKIGMLRAGRVPFFEPGLEDLVTRNQAAGRLSFDTDLKAAVGRSRIIFIAVGTPPREDGSADLGPLFTVAEGIAGALTGPGMVVIKSTVPVGTAKGVHDLIAGRSSHPCEVVSNPEFLKEGDAVNDFLKPDRIIIGTRSQEARELLAELYAPFVRTGNPILFMDWYSAEMTKYGSNSLLATRVTFMNEIANLCERVGADVDLVRRGMSTDHRIGHHFLFPGVGYGGSCFPKDVRALCKTAEEHGYPLSLLQTVDEVNTRQKVVLVEKMLQHFDGELAGREVAVWGLSFKPRTDDMREAPAVSIIERLLELGAGVRASDPVALQSGQALFGERVLFYRKAYEAVAGADALAVVTEWNEYRTPDFDRLKELMRQPVIFDGRNIYNPERMRARGFIYYSIGRP